MRVEGEPGCGGMLLSVGGGGAGELVGGWGWIGSEASSVRKVGEGVGLGGKGGTGFVMVRMAGVLGGEASSDMSSGWFEAGALRSHAFSRVLRPFCRFERSLGEDCGAVLFFWRLLILVRF